MRRVLGTTGGGDCAWWLRYLRDSELLGEVLELVLLLL